MSQTRGTATDTRLRNARVCRTSSLLKPVAPPKPEDFRPTLSPDLPAPDADVVRSFLAASVPLSVRDAYADVFAAARERFGGLRWVAPANVHLTLRFFGDATVGARDDLVERVARAATGIPPIEIELGAPGHFGRPQAPRALWFSVARGAEPLGRVAHACEEAARAAGFRREKRPWTAHYTVARNPRSRVVEGWHEFLSASPLPGLCWLLEDIKLYASRPRREGPSYTPLSSIKLGSGCVS